MGVFGLAFPFVPRHLTIISSLTIGTPAFFLALAPNGTRAKPGFMKRVLRFAIPAGVMAFTATFSAYVLATKSDGVSLGQARTMATVVLFCVAVWVLGILARPWNWWRLGLVSLMIGAFVLVLAVPPMARYFALDLPNLTVVFAGFGIAATACLLLEAGWRIFGWIEKPTRGDDGDEDEDPSPVVPRRASATPTRAAVSDDPLEPEAASA